MTEFTDEGDWEVHSAWAIAEYSCVQSIDEVLQAATVRLKLTQWLTGIGDYRNIEKPVHLRFKGNKA